MSSWDPEVLARLGQLHLRARQLVAGLTSGGHPSERISRSVEFADYKEYSPGDSIRDLDWRILARSDRLVVRRQQAETELAVTFILDASGDLATGESGRYHRPPLRGTKLGAALTLLATMAYYLHHSGEPVGLAILGGEGVPQRWIPPRRSRSHIAQLFATLAAVRPAGRDVLGAGLSTLGQRMVRRSAVVLVSDLMEEPAQWGPALAALTRRQIDLRVAHIYDRREWTMDYRTSARFFSPEGGEALPVDPGAVRDAFADVVEEYLTEVRGWLASRSAQHVLVPSDAPLEQPIGRLLRGM